MTKLVLGSAQFGFRYGATNNKEKISNKDIEKILNLSSIKKIKYINGVNGAPCTLHLKKNVRFKIEKHLVCTALDCIRQ
jgi:hypothetical protein